MGMNLLVGYTGAYPDPVTGGYPLGNGYRMYLPELMRFTSPDDWSPFGAGGVNPYIYCGNDPISHADPSGHFWDTFFQSLNIALMFVPGGEGAGEMAERAIAASNAARTAAEVGAEEIMAVGEDVVASPRRPASAADDLAPPAKRIRMEAPRAPSTSTPRPNISPPSSSLRPLGWESQPIAYSLAQAEKLADGVEAEVWGIGGSAILGTGRAARPSLMRMLRIDDRDMVMERINSDGGIRERLYEAREHLDSAEMRLEAPGIDPKDPDLITLKGRFNRLNRRIISLHQWTASTAGNIMLGLPTPIL